MKFRASTIVFKSVLKAGLIFGSAFCLGFFAWPWVAYGATPNETFDSLTVGDLGGQSSWVNLVDDADVEVASGTDKHVVFSTTEAAQKAFSNITDDLIEITIDTASFYDNGDYVYLRFCNGDSAVNCIGSGKAGWIIKFTYTSSGFYTVRNQHSDASYDTFMTAANGSVPITYGFYLDTSADRIYLKSCNSLWCELVGGYAPYYVADTIDDVDFIIMEANLTSGYDVSIDDLIGSEYTPPEYAIEEVVLPDWTGNVELSSEEDIMYDRTTYCTVGFTCKLKLMWNYGQDGNTFYLTDDLAETQYSIITSDEITQIHFGYFNVPTQTEATTSTYNICVDDIVDYYPDEDYVCYQNVEVKWTTDDIASVISSFFEDCSAVCDDISTSTDDTFWDNQLHAIDCGWRKVTCWMITPDTQTIVGFNETVNNIKNVFPYSLATQATGEFYNTDANGVLSVVSTSTLATTTLDMSVAFPPGTAVIPVLSNKMFVGTEVDTFLTFVKSKISMLLYALLFFYIFVRVMGTAWLPTPKAPKIEVPEQIKRSNVINLRTAKGDRNMRIDLRKRHY